VICILNTYVLQEVHVAQPFTSTKIGGQIGFTDSAYRNLMKLNKMNPKPWDFDKAFVDSKKILLQAGVTKSCPGRSCKCKPMELEKGLVDKDYVSAHPELEFHHRGQGRYAFGPRPKTRKRE
jgi:hypothetical protein